MSNTILVIYTKKLLNPDWLRLRSEKCVTQVQKYTSAKSVIQCKLHNHWNSVHWLMNNRVWSGTMKSFVFKSSARFGWRNIYGAIFP